MASEKPFRQLAELECARRDWLVIDTSWTKFFKGRPYTFDLFGDAKARPKVKGIDMLAADCEGDFYGIQFTGDSGGNVSARVKGCRANRKLMEFAARGLHVVVWGFKTKGSKVLLREEIVTP